MNSHNNRRVGFVLVMLFLVLSIGSVSALYFIGRHYTGVYLFNSSLWMLAQGASLDDIEARTVDAYGFSNDDAYARRLAEYQIARMNNLLTVAEPTEEQKRQFNTAFQSALNAAQVATVGDDSDPRNAYTLGSVYATLVPAKIEGAYERSIELFIKAKELDPHNPLRLLLLAELAFAAGREVDARMYVGEATGMKSNYSDALFFLAQMDIAAGNTDAAISASRAIIVLEPQNPVRFFQLGVLLFSTKQYVDAVSALLQAVALDGNYANARFYLALAYDTLHRTNDARDQLTTLLTTNPGNEVITTLLGRLDRGEPLVDTTAGPVPLSESSGVTEQDDGAVTADQKPDTPLVSPVNTSGDNTREDTSAETTAQ